MNIHQGTRYYGIPKDTNINKMDSALNDNQV